MKLLLTIHTLQNITSIFHEYIVLLRLSSFSGPTTAKLTFLRLHRPTSIIKRVMTKQHMLSHTGLRFLSTQGQLARIDELTII